MNKQQVVYRIVTERTPAYVRNIKRILGELHLDFSMCNGVGSYHLTDENSVVIELAFVSRNRALVAAKLIGRANRQECILFQEIPCTSTLIGTGVEV